ncbi:MAG: hypothetical protein II590_07550 [Clostridia bacterium]|nr:hypothetical protein [Clostridia bacterium]
MLTVDKLIEKLGLDVIELADGSREIKGGYAGDLLSWVMGRAQPDDAWVTIMSNMNVSAVAQLTDVACVIFAEGVAPDPEALNKAKMHGINLLGSRKGMFELCGDVKDAMLSEAHAEADYAETEERN